MKGWLKVLDGGQWAVGRRRGILSVRGRVWGLMVYQLVRPLAISRYTPVVLMFVPDLQRDPAIRNDQVETAPELSQATNHMTAIP